MLSDLAVSSNRCPLPCFQDEEVGPINLLSDEVLLQILCAVPVADVLLRVPLVCKRWHRLSNDPEVWRHQELHYRTCSSDADFADLVRVVRLPRLSKVDLTGMTAGSVAEQSLEAAIVEVSYRMIHLSRVFLHFF